ncbi:MAG: YjjG family noncanonical pyrimidine nucleotidase [Porphyromonas sp.]|nr:YjjG family noncanonical pyrimidine nucleotidase [Porphyromonas sp.]
MIKAVFIDLDDTLWATKENNRDALEELFHKHKWGGNPGDLYPSFEKFYEIYFPYNELLWSRYARKEISKDELKIDRLRYVLSSLYEYSDEDYLNIHDEYFSIANTKDKLLPYAVEVVRELHRSYPVVVISNGFVEVQYNKLARAGLTPYVDHMVLSEEVGISKPFKPIFAKALSLVHCKPNEAVMIGDAWETDIEGALRSGIHPIWLKHDASTMTPEAGAEVVEIASLQEVQAAIKKINMRLLQHHTSVRFPSKSKIKTII